MKDDVATSIVPPVCPTATAVGAVFSESVSLALWERYYVLYSAYLRHLCGVAWAAPGLSSGVEPLSTCTGVGVQGEYRGGDVDSACCQAVVGGDVGHTGRCDDESASRDVSGCETRDGDGVDGGASQQTRSNGAAVGGGHVQESLVRLGDITPWQGEGPHGGRHVCSDCSGSNTSCGSDNGVSGHDARESSRAGGCAVASVVQHEVNDGAKRHANFNIRGPNYLRNKANRDRKKKNKERNNSSRFVGYFDSCDDEVKKTLRDSRAEFLIQRNKREAMVELRKAELLNAVDIDDEKKHLRVKMNAATERGMVSIEKTHAKLASLGDVPGNMTGFAATILGSGSISPNSSASEAEFRKCQKALLDSEEHKQRMIAVIVAAGLEVPGNPQEERDLNHEDGIWTVNSENERIIDDTYSNYGVMHDYLGTGKMRIIPV